MTSNLAAGTIKSQSPLLHAAAEETEKQGRPEAYLRLMNEFTHVISSGKTLSWNLGGI